MTAIEHHDISPPQRRVFGHLPAFKRDPLGFLLNCANRYRGVVPLRMLNRQVFLLLEPEDIDRVLVTEHANFIKPAWLRTPTVRRLLGDGLVTSEGDEWRQQRMACRPAFESSRVEGYGRAISAITTRTLTSWAPGQTIDIHREMARLTMGIVGSLLFGMNADDTDWITVACEAMDTLMIRFTAGPGLFGMIPLPPGPAETMAARRLNGVVDRLIRVHTAACTDGSPDAADAPNLLSMLRRCNPEGSAEHRVRLLREQVRTFLTAGHESSAIAVSWAFLLLTQHPAAEKRMRDELITTLCGRAPVFSDMRKLPYTEAIVHEALRLYPPLWMTGRQSVHAGYIGGASVPAGALVMTSQWALHRLPQLFSRPNDFRPERWLNGETSGLPRCAYIPFGAGPRTCIGRSFAMMESVMMLAAIAQRFQLSRIDDSEVTPWPTMTLRPPLGIRLNVLPQPLL